MDSDSACGLVPVAPHSRRAGTRAGSVSLPEYQSLRSPRDFRRVLGTGTRIRQGDIVLVTSPGEPGPPRVGLIVSRGGGGAVTRNRVKRRLRHALLGKQLKPGTDYVIIASRQVNQAPFAELESWLTRALEASVS